MGSKACRLEYCTNNGNALKICSSGRNEGPTTVVVDKYFKSSSCDDGEEREEQIGDHLVAIKILAENNNRVERFGKDGRYPKRDIVHHSMRSA